jgi:hypothetical protein
MALTNLFQKQAEEAEKGFAPYSIFTLTGTVVFIKSFFDHTWCNLTPEYKSRIYVYRMENNASPGFHIYKYYSYRTPGQHWSERQKSELLFTCAEHASTQN